MEREKREDVVCVVVEVLMLEVVEQLCGYNERQKQTLDKLVKDFQHSREREVSRGWGGGGGGHQEG